jgi:hypothetical protein
MDRGRGAGGGGRGERECKRAGERARARGRGEGEGGSEAGRERVVCYRRYKTHTNVCLVILSFLIHVSSFVHVCENDRD